eukprot:comp20140_c0_seq2/m.24891 comp20140_c0_seq2/g.24891  ORF comp20140_c0_seq2/g.24891 comp20140_c0_seq2/m.24891 type:complete len:136 (-) comp20140_c0_seq2:82-489(-)
MESDDMEADTLPPDPLRVEESLVPLLTKLRIQTTEQKGLIGGGVALVRPPRWKKYEKAKHTMTWMDKRRLDNIIWRAWHLHCTCMATQLVACTHTHRHRGIHRHGHTEAHTQSRVQSHVCTSPQTLHRHICAPSS